MLVVGRSARSEVLESRLSDLRGFSRWKEIVRAGGAREYSVAVTAALDRRGRPPTAWCRPSSSTPAACRCRACCRWCSRCAHGAAARSTCSPSWPGLREPRDCSASFSRRPWCACAAGCPTAPSAAPSACSTSCSPRWVIAAARCPWPAIARGHQARLARPAVLPPGARRVCAVAASSFVKFRSMVVGDHPAAPPRIRAGADRGRHGRPCEQGRPGGALHGPQDDRRRPRHPGRAASCAATRSTSCPSSGTCCAAT